VSGTTSGALYELARQALAPDAPPRRGARVDAADKRALLREGLRRHGADGVLAVGERVRAIAFDPVVAVFRLAVSPEDLIHRWQRMERYFHSHHRVRIVERSPRCLSVEHHATRGPAPILEEDLLIAGLLAALLSDAGAEGLDARLGTCGPFFRLADRPRPVGEARPDAARRVSFRWAAFSPRPRETPDPGPAVDLADGLARLLEADPGRDWRLADAARALHSTPRSLQRALARRGTGFRSRLLEVRVDRAARLVAAGAGLADAGFAAGFADQPHFTREFSRRVGLPPGTWRTELDART
jgi:AraC-like DNA-binding protein